MAHKFLIGGLAGMTAIACVHPMDLIKVRLQTAGLGGSKEYTGIFNCIATVVKEEGFFALYRGLTANFLRQITYTTTRLGLFVLLSNIYTSKVGKLTFLIRTIFGLIAGGVGSFVGTPADVALVRMTADGAAPPDKRRGYKNVCDALYRIRKEEGILTWWRGWKVTVIRASVTNAVGLGTYSQAKSMLITDYDMPDAVGVHFIASMISGILVTLSSMPIDICKTRLQNMKIVDGEPEYKGMIDVFIKTVRNEGFFALWKGTLAYYSRVGPKNVLTFIFFEQLSNLWNYFVSGKQKSSGL